jgi:hypothetical protein
MLKSAVFIPHCFSIKCIANLHFSISSSVAIIVFGIAGLALAVLVILVCAMQMHRKRRSNGAGKLVSALTECAKMHGAGKARTLPDMLSSSDVGNGHIESLFLCRCTHIEAMNMSAC